MLDTVVDVNYYSYHATHMRKCLRPKDFFSNWITLNTRDVLSGEEGWLELALSYLVNTEVWGPSEVSKYVLRIT